MLSPAETITGVGVRRLQPGQVAREVLDPAGGIAPRRRFEPAPCKSLIASTWTSTLDPCDDSSDGARIAATRATLG